MNITYWSVRLASRRGGDGVFVVTLATYKFHFSRVHDNIVQDLRNDKYITQVYSDLHIILTDMYVCIYVCTVHSTLMPKLVTYVRPVVYQSQGGDNGREINVPPSIKYTFGCSVE